MLVCFTILRMLRVLRGERVFLLDAERSVETAGSQFETAADAGADFQTADSSGWYGRHKEDKLLCAFVDRGGLYRVSAVGGAKSKCLRRRLKRRI